MNEHNIITIQVIKEEIVRLIHR